MWDFKHSNLNRTPKTHNSTNNHTPQTFRCQRQGLVTPSNNNSEVPSSTRLNHHNQAHTISKILTIRLLHPALTTQSQMYLKKVILHNRWNKLMTSLSLRLKSKIYLLLKAPFILLNLNVMKYSKLGEDMEWELNLEIMMSKLKVLNVNKPANLCIIKLWK